MRKEREKAAAAKEEKEGAQKAMDLIFGPPEGCESSSLLSLELQNRTLTSPLALLSLVGGALADCESSLRVASQALLLLTRSLLQFGTTPSRLNSLILARVAPPVCSFPPTRRFRLTDRLFLLPFAEEKKRKSSTKDKKDKDNKQPAKKRKTSDGAVEGEGEAQVGRSGEWGKFGEEGAEFHWQNEMGGGEQGNC